MIVKLLASGNRVVRPKDAVDLYDQPSKEFARLAKSGVLFRLSRGYFAVVPEEMRGGQWQPTIESAALGMAIADYGAETVALMGMSAARVLGYLPRAIGSAVVAIPTQRPVRKLSVGTAVFVLRDVASLDVQLVETDLVAGFTTTAEQTALDIAHRPTRGGVSSATAVEVLTAIASELDWGVVSDLTMQQRKHTAAARLAWIASSVVDPPALPKPRAPVAALGLRVSGARAAAEFGVVE